MRARLFQNIPVSAIPGSETPPHDEEIDMEDMKTENAEIEEVNKILKRREFMGLATAMAAVGVGAALPASIATAADGPSTPFTRWLDTIDGKHRVVLDMREHNGGMALGWAWVYFLTASQAYGVPQEDIGVVLVMRHNAIPVALDDSAWEKYNLGELFDITDYETGAPALRNPFYTTMGEGFLPDMALQKLIDRGVNVGACDMAIHHYSSVAAAKMGMAHEDVKADWNNAVLPGITHMPSGLVACQGAMTRGCSYLYAG
jgi:hypothetical protein